MKVRGVSGAAALALALLMLTAPGQAIAAVPQSSTFVSTHAVEYTPSPELQGYLDSLSSAQRADFIRDALPATVTETVTITPLDSSASASLARAGDISPQAISCWSVRAGWEAKNVIGVALYNWYQVGGWCAEGGTVLSAGTLGYGGQTVAVGWRYEGRTANASGVIANQGRSYGQFKFVLGVGGWDVDTRLECARVRGQASGTALVDQVCGIY